MLVKPILPPLLLYWCSYLLWMSDVSIEQRTDSTTHYLPYIEWDGRISMFTKLQLSVAVF